MALNNGFDPIALDRWLTTPPDDWFDEAELTPEELARLERKTNNRKAARKRRKQKRKKQTRS